MPLVKDTPTIEINYDKYGYCVKCHKNMLKQTVVTGDDGRLTVVDMFTADQSTTQILLNDGSKATIMICKSCKEGLTDNDNEYIMNCLLKGWEMETNEMVESNKFPSWDKKKQKEYLKKYSELEIVGNVERLKADQVDNMLKNFKGKKKGVKRGSSK